MEAAYCAILDRRREQLVQQIAWSSSLTRGLVTEGIMTKDELKKIEMEKAANRVFLLIAHVESSKDPATFPQFCKVLQQSGHIDVAESLLFDKDRIKWDFAKDVKVGSAADYIKVLENDVLHPALDDRDDFRRSARMKEVKRRLAKLSEHIRRKQQIETSFKKNLLNIKSSKEADSFWSEVCSREVSRKTLEQCHDLSQDTNDKLCKHLTLMFKQSQKENQDLAQHVQNLKESLKQKEDEVPSLIGKSSASADKDVELLKKALARQDQNFLQLKRETEAEKRDCVQVNKKGLESVLSMLGPFRTGSANGRRAETSPDMVEQLQEGVSGLLDQLKRLKTRISKETTHALEMEQERDMAFAVLNIRNTKNLSLKEALKKKLGEMSDEINQLRKENKELRQRIEALEEENQELRDSVKAMQDKVSDFACADTKSATRKPFRQSYERGWRP